MYDWNDLKFFLAVARNGSTIAAARALNTSQSTVQRRLVELERSLGQRLVTRHPRGYRLTALGEALLPLAENAESAAFAVERHVAASAAEPAGIIRLTCPEALVNRFATSGLLDAFHRRHPAMAVELVMGDRFMDLASGEAGRRSRRRRSRRAKTGDFALGGLRQQVICRASWTAGDAGRTRQPCRGGIRRADRRTQGCEMAPQNRSECP
jgi:DNA-binding transcriptional LysR family regulator